MTRRYKLFGTLIIEENGRSAPLLKYKKGCALIVYLLVTRQPQSREVVADLLWDASSTAQSLRNLRKLLHQLRQHVPELQVSRQRLAFHLEDGVDIDVYTLEGALASENIDRIDQTLSLYTGELLADFYLEDAPRFNEWLMLAREQWRQQVWDGYTQLCAAFNSQQSWQRGIDAARRWLQLDTLDEEIHRQLMQFLAADGQIETALQQYEACRQELAQELGVEPDSVTQALAAQLKQLEWPKPGQLAMPGALPQHSFLPYHRNTTFVGRADDLQQLAAHLMPQQGVHDGLTKAAVITGMGGLGKTQLAVEYAYRYGRYYAGGVYWISLADAGNVEEEVAKIGGERGMKLYRTTHSLSLADQVSRVQSAWQEPIPRLLIFDNCEDENLAADWLPVSGGCSVLVTSRRGQWPPELPLTEYPLLVLQRPESVALLQQLAQNHTENDLATLAAELGDHPLALQLAGHYLARHDHVRPNDYLTQLQNEQVLEHGSLQGQFSRYSPTAHELHVARTFAISYEQLDTTNAVDTMALNLLARAACFAPGEPIPKDLLFQTITIDASNAPAQSILENALARLLSLGLLEAKGHEILVMHRLLALFTQQASTHPLNTERIVEELFIQQLLAMPQIQYALLHLPIPTAHLHHATDVALKRADLAAATLALFFSSYLHENSKLKEAEDYAQQAYTIRRDLLTEHDPKIMACQIQLGKIYWSLQNYDQAEMFLQQALASCNLHEETDPVMQAEAYMCLGQVYHHTAKHEEAQAHFEKALSFFDADGETHHPIEARTLHELGTLYLNNDQYEQAQAVFERALPAYEAVVGREHPATAATLQNLAILHYRMGDQEGAFHYFQEVLALSEKLFGIEHHVTAAAYNGLGVYHLGMAQYEKAHWYFENALAVRQKILGPENVHTAFSLNNVGLTAVKLGDYSSALKYHQQAITTLEDLLGPEHMWTCHIISWYGESLIEMGEHTLAQEYLERALMAQEATYGTEHPQTAVTILRLGMLYLHLGQPDTAESYLTQALQLHQKLLDDNHLDIARTHRFLGELYQQKQNNNLARVQFETALAIYRDKLPSDHPDIQHVQRNL